MEPKSVQLQPDWGLLDSTFESYKLSLQQLPIYPLDLDCKVDTVTGSSDDFSYGRTRALSLHSYLFGDPWCEKDCYFIDGSGHIKRVSVVVETTLQPPASVFKLDPHFLQSERHTPVTISFPSPELCLVSDGAGMVYVLDTGDRRSESRKWEVLLMEGIAGSTTSPSMLLHSSFQKVSQVESGDGMSQDKDVINVLMLRFEDEKKDKTDVTMAVVEWVVLSRIDATAKYSIESQRFFKGKNAPFFGAFGESGNELFLGAQSLLTFIPDWNQQLQMDEMEIDIPDANMDTAVENGDTTHEWKQSSEDATVYFTLPDDIEKENIVYSLTKEKLQVAYKLPAGDVCSLLVGKLFGEVEPEASNWTLEDKRLVVNLQKNVHGQTWPCIVEGDTSGKRLISEEDTSPSMAELQEMDARGGQSVGLEPYEECDDLPDVDSMLYRFDSATNTFTHESSVASNQWLFNCLYCGKMCTVLRHDVDALVWEVKTPTTAGPEPWKHVATFNALGYVRASKEDLKFSGCSPNASYAALCESYRRIFVYHGPTISKKPLRNRSTGKDVHISKQQVVTLPSNDPIIGFVATSEHIFALTDSKLFIVKVTTPET